MSHSRPKALQIAAIAATAATVVVGLAACSSTSSGSSTPTSTKAAAGAIAAVPSIAAKLPSDVKKSGVLTVGVSLNFAPYEFKDENGQPTGSEIDVANAVAATLGLKAQTVATTFPGLLTGLQAKRFDVVLSGMNDTAERQKQVDFVNFNDLSNNFLATKAVASKITNDHLSLCGLTAAETIGTTYVATIQGFSQACVAAGKKPIKVQTFDTGNDMFTGLVAGRADFTYGANGVNAYQAKKSNGAMVVAGEPEDPQPEGFVIEKGNDQLTTAITDAVNHLITSGQLKTVLTKWGLQDTVYEKATVNNPVSPAAK